MVLDCVDCGVGLPCEWLVVYVWLLVSCLAGFMGLRNIDFWFLWEYVFRGFWVLD